MVTNMYIYTIYILNIIYYIYIIMKSHIFHAMKSHETPNDGQFFSSKSRRRPSYWQLHRRDAPPVVPRSAIDVALQPALAKRRDFTQGKLKTKQINCSKIGGICHIMPMTWDFYGLLSNFLMVLKEGLGILEC
jgi:hypothetical protein